MPKTARDQLWILLAAGAVFLTNLGGAALWDLDEAVYANCARGMWERQDWIVPEYPHPYEGDKPPMLHWMMMLGFLTFGVNEFAARLPAAICGIGTALIVYHLGRRMLSREAGLWAGLITASTLLFTVSARAATTDSILTLLNTAAIGLFATAGAGSAARAKPTWLAWAAIWTCLALAVLTKGPIGMLLPAAAIGLFLMIVNHQTQHATTDAEPAHGWSAWLRGWLRFVGPANFLRSLWQMRPITGTAILLAVAGTWFVLVGLRTDGAWLEAFFMKNNVLRFVEPSLGHSGPVWYYLVVILVGLFPWSVFFGPAGGHAVRQTRGDAPNRLAYVLAWCWIGIWLVFFSISNTKLPNYILPAVPAIALLTGDFLAAWLAATDRKTHWWVHSSGATMVGVGLIAAVALPIVTRMFVPKEVWLTAITLVPIIGGAVWWWLAATDRRGPALSAFAATSVVLLVAVFAVGAARVSRYRNAPWLGQTVAGEGATHRQVASYGYFRHSFAYYLGGPIPRLNEPEQIDAFLNATDGGYVVARQADAQELIEAFPRRLVEVSRQRRFLESDDLVLLGERPHFTAERPRRRIDR